MRPLSPDNAFLLVNSNGKPHALAPLSEYDELTHTMPQAPQTLANHVRFDPPFHFFLAPGSLIVFLISAVHLVRHPSTEAALLAAGLLLLLVNTLMTRVYSLKVQDRVIRLEERLRLASLSDPGLATRLPELEERQLVALRFASDAEAPSLVRRALEERLPPKAIKAAVRAWRPDYFRL